MKAVPRSLLGGDGVLAGSDGAFLASVEVILLPSDASMQYFLLPSVGKESVSPLWCVRTTEEKAVSNVEWASFSLTTLCAFTFDGDVKPAFHQTAASATEEEQDKKKQAASHAAGRRKQNTKASAKPKAKVTPGPRGAKRNALSSGIDANTDAARDGETKRPQDEVHSLTVRIPVLLNTKVVRAGEELLVWQPWR